MNRKRNKTTGFKILKYLPGIFLCFLIFPVNYSGKTLRVKTNSCGPEFSNKECPYSTVKSSTNVNDAATSNPVEDKVGDNAQVTVNVVIISIFLLILSTILISLILRYFYGVSILKQSLTLFLYQDVAKLLLLLNGLLSLAIFILYSNGNGSSNAMPPTFAKIFTYCTGSLILHLLLAGNVLAFLHLYSMKKMVVVPPWTWMEDERVAMKKMRLTSLGLVTFGMTLMFAYQAYPKLYYIMMGDLRPFTELPIGTFVHVVLSWLLVITYIISSLAATLYERRCVIVDDTIVPRWPGPTVFVTVLLIGKYWGGMKFLNLLLTFQVCVVVFVFAIIATSCQLRGYLRAIFKDFQDAALVMKDYFPLYRSLRSPQVHPIQE